MLIVFHGRNALQFCVQWLHYIGNKLTYSQMSIIYPISVYWIFQVIRGVPWFFTTWLSSYIPHIIFSLLYIFWCCFVSSDCCLVTRLCLTLLAPSPWTVALQIPLPWNSPGKNIGVGCHCLLQGIFLTQGLNLSILYGQANSLLLSPQGSTPFLFFFPFQ